MYKLWSSSLWSLLHTPFSSLLGPNIHLRILFSNILSLDSSLNVRDHVSQSYSTTGNDYNFIYRYLKVQVQYKHFRECRYSSQWSILTTIIVNTNLNLSVSLFLLWIRVHYNWESFSYQGFCGIKHDTSILLCRARLFGKQTQHIWLMAIQNPVDLVSNPDTAAYVVFSVLAPNWYYGYYGMRPWFDSRWGRTFGPV